MKHLDESREAIKAKRRRLAHSDAGDHISNANLHYSMQLDRHFGKYTADLKEALERGSA